MRKIRKSLISTLVLSLLPGLVWAGPVNINTADVRTLAKELDGIGAAKAQAIVDYRQAHGPFVRPEDLAKVKGIGSRVVNQNRGNILVSNPESKPRKK